MVTSDAECIHGSANVVSRVMDLQSLVFEQTVGAELDAGMLVVRVFQVGRIVDTVQCMVPERPVEILRSLVSHITQFYRIGTYLCRIVC